MTPQLWLAGEDILSICCEFFVTSAAGAFAEVSGRADPLSMRVGGGVRERWWRVETRTVRQAPGKPEWGAEGGSEQKVEG